MAGGKNEAIAIGPYGIRRIVLQVSLPQFVNDRRKTHRSARMPRICLLHGVDRKGPDGIDGKLVDSLGANRLDDWCLLAHKSSCTDRGACMAGKPPQWKSGFRCTRGAQRVGRFYVNWRRNAERGKASTGCGETPTRWRSVGPTDRARPDWRSLRCSEQALVLRPSLLGRSAMERQFSAQVRALPLALKLIREPCPAVERYRACPPEKDAHAAQTISRRGRSTGSLCCIPGTRSFARCE